MSDAAPIPRVLEVDSTSDLVVLKVRVPGESALFIVGATRDARGAGLVTAEERRAAWGGRLPLGSARQKAREAALEGAALVGLSEAGLFLVPRAGDDTPSTPARVIAPDGAKVVVRDARPDEVPEATFATIDDAARAAWHARGRALLASAAEAALGAQRGALGAALERGTRRVDRRLEAIRGDLAKIDEAGHIAAQAQWLVTEATRAKRGATSLVVTDWSSGEPVELRVPLDPAKPPREQVEAMFRRAKRLRLGAKIAAERLRIAEGQAAALADAREKVALATSLAELVTLGQAAKRAAPRDVSLPEATGGAGGGRSEARSGKAVGRVAYRAFAADSGRRLLVGKGAADNDTLTLKVARPHDLWVHAKDQKGAHVIVALEKGKTCPAEDLVDAAHLAAHFSDARDELVVDVQYTPRRYLRKPRGAAPGFVVVDREKVLVLRVDAARTRALLEREEL